MGRSQTRTDCSNENGGTRERTALAPHHSDGRFNSLNEDEGERGRFNGGARARGVKCAKARAVCQTVHFPNRNLNAFLSNNSGGMSETAGEGGRNVPHTIPIGDAGCSCRFGAVRKSLSYERSLSKRERGANEGTSARPAFRCVRSPRMMRICVIVPPCFAKNGARLMLGRRRARRERNCRWRWHRL